MDCSPPCSSVHGILLARILEWVAISFSRESSRPTDRTQVSCIDCRQTHYQLSYQGSFKDWLQWFYKLSLITFLFIHLLKSFTHIYPLYLQIYIPNLSPFYCLSTSTHHYNSRSVYHSSSNFAPQEFICHTVITEMFKIDICWTFKTLNIKS